MTLTGIKREKFNEQLFESMTDSEKETMNIHTQEEFNEEDRKNQEQITKEKTEAKELGITWKEFKLQKKGNDTTLKKPTKKPHIRIKNLNEDKHYKDKLKEKQKEISTIIKIKPDQFNALVHSGTVMASFMMHKESVNIDDTTLFSQQLYNIADVNGWLKDVTFMPYVFLLASATELGAKMINQPDTIKKEKSGVMAEKGQIKQVISDDELIAKIGGQSRMSDKERKNKLEGFGRIG